ncbi:RPM1-interacting protein 4-like [Typha latifolia]|uniref:RPM1-interacting protein 4-like n=1 Tax=Typha latifolia TaxID=4733 RepID=UPI003C2B8685
MAQANVPEFGKWGSGDVPYTQYFDDARKKRNTGMVINPKDTNQNAETNSKPADASAPRIETGNPKPKDVASAKRQETDSRRSAGPSLRHEQQYKGQANNATPERRPNRMSANQSPLNPIHQSKPTYRGESNHSAERRTSSDKHASNAPGKVGRKHGGRGNESPEQDLAVPPFGSWDDNKAESGDSYTGIFKKLREDRASPMIPGRSPYPTSHEKNKSPQVKKCSCFSWLGL